MTRRTFAAMITCGATTLAMLMSPLLSGIVHAGEVAKYKGNGAYAGASGADASGCLAFSLQVWRNGSGSTQETFLYYDVYNFCTGEWGSGYGAIPNDNLRVSKKQTVLNTTVDVNSAFSAWGVTGTIALTFVPNGVSTSAYSGHSEFTFMNDVVRSHGSWKSQSASVTGRALSFDITNAWAEVGTSMTRSIEIERGK